MKLFNVLAIRKRLVLQLLNYSPGDLSTNTDAILDKAISLLEQRDFDGRTALMLAASEGHTSLIELFLDKGSILETRDKEGLTVLGWACLRGRITIVQMLLDRGANIGTNDNTGRTPLDLAAFQVEFVFIYANISLSRVLLTISNIHKIIKLHTG